MTRHVPITSTMLDQPTEPTPSDVEIIAEALEHRARELEFYAVVNSPHPTLGTPLELMDRVRVLRREAKRLQVQP